MNHDQEFESARFKADLLASFKADAARCIAEYPEAAREINLLVTHMEVQFDVIPQLRPARTTVRTSPPWTPSCHCVAEAQRRAHAVVLALDVFANPTIEGEPETWPR